MKEKKILRDYSMLTIITINLTYHNLILLTKLISVHNVVNAT